MFMDIIYNRIIMHIQMFFSSDLFIYCCVLGDRVWTGKVSYIHVYLYDTGVPAKLQRTISSW